MRNTLRWASLLLVLMLATSVLTAGGESKKDGKDSKDGDTPKSKKTEKFTYDPKGLTGTLSKLENSTKNFTVKVTASFPDPNRVAENQAHYNRRVLEISRIKNAVERQRQTLALQQDMARRNANVPLKKLTKEFDYVADENVKVRIKELPPKVDDKGNTVKYTKKEKEELKGTGDDAKLTGYAAEYDQLRTGQTVTVYTPKKKAASKDAKKTEDGEAPAVERQTAVMILIVAEPAPKN
jgi:hypothetical protein